VYIFPVFAKDQIISTDNKLDCLSRDNHGQNTNTEK